MRQIQSGLPFRLYKYRAFTKENINCLNNDSLWFSPRSLVNDPHEGIVDIGKIVDDYIADYSSSEEYRECLMNFVSNCLNSLRDDYNICSFASEPDNRLMWAHYADSNKGYCLEFHVLKDPKLFAPMIPVVYDRDVKPTKMENLLEHLFQRKNAEWSYEKEVRIICPCSNPLQHYKRDALVSVIFGNKMPEDNRALIRNILGDSVLYKELKPDDNSFNYTIVNVVE